MPNELRLYYNGSTKLRKFAITEKAIFLPHRNGWRSHIDSHLPGAAEEIRAGNKIPASNSLVRFVFDSLARRRCHRRHVEHSCCVFIIVNRDRLYAIAEARTPNLNVCRNGLNCFPANAMPTDTHTRARCACKIVQKSCVWLTDREWMIAIRLFGIEVCAHIFASQQCTLYKRRPSNENKCAGLTVHNTNCDNSK